MRTAADCPVNCPRLIISENRVYCCCMSAFLPMGVIGESLEIERIEDVEQKVSTEDI